jgi:hypothetical protein
MRTLRRSSSITPRRRCRSSRATTFASGSFSAGPMAKPPLLACSLTASMLTSSYRRTRASLFPRTTRSALEARECVDRVVRIEGIDLRAEDRTGHSPSRPCAIPPLRRRSSPGSRRQIPPDVARPFERRAAEKDEARALGPRQIDRPVDTRRASHRRRFRAKLRSRLWSLPEAVSTQGSLWGRSQWRENDSSLNGDVSMGDSLGTLIFIKPKPVAS